MWRMQTATCSPISLYKKDMAVPSLPILGRFSLNGRDDRKWGLGRVYQLDDGKAFEWGHPLCSIIPTELDHLVVHLNRALTIGEIFRAHIRATLHSNRQSSLKFDVWICYGLLRLILDLPSAKYANYGERNIGSGSIHQRGKDLDYQ